LLLERPFPGRLTLPGDKGNLYNREALLSALLKMRMPIASQKISAGLRSGKPSLTRQDWIRHGQLTRA
jgi:hypothetical protein